MMLKKAHWHLSLICGGLCISALASAATEYSPNEVIVKYKNGALRTRQMVNRLYDTAGVRGVRHFSSRIMAGMEHLILSENVKVQDAIAALMHDPSVEYAQPNYILHAYPVQKESADEILNEDSQPFGQPMLEMIEPEKDKICPIPGIPFPPGCHNKPGHGGGGGGNGGNNPIPIPAKRPELQAAPAEVLPAVEDPELSKAYGLEKISAPDAWTTFKGSKDVVVAVIDTGIDYNHEDLAFNVWRNPNPGTDHDVVGYDFVHNDGLPWDDDEHGTHTAGVIGAVGGNGKGISGVSQRVSLMALKFLSVEGNGTTIDAIRAIDYAVNHGAKILSNSWGGKGDENNKALFEAIERAKAKGVLFVVASGNEGTDNDGANPDYPAAFNNDNLITVGATDKNDKLAFFSNYGKKTTHVTAPGQRIYSTVPGNKYAFLSGTSMACPYVAGAAALIWAKNPSWTYHQVKDALLQTADPLPGLKEKTITGGRINVSKALSYNSTAASSDSRTTE